MPSRARSRCPSPASRSTNTSPRGYSTVAGHTVEPLVKDRRRSAEDTTSPASALGLDVVSVGVTLIWVENVYSFGWKMYNALHIADHRRFRSKLRVLNNGRWCRGRWRGLAGPHASTPGAAGVEGAGGTGGPCRGAVGGGGAWPGFETTRRAEGSRRGRLAGGPTPTGTHSGPAPQPGPPAPGTPAEPQRMFHVKHLPNHRPRYPVWPGKWHT